MINFSFVIQDKQGIHARPAGILVKTASQFKSAATMHCNNKSADLKRVFAVMSLGVKAGMLVTVKVEGEDEVAAKAAIEACLKSNL